MPNVAWIGKCWRALREGLELLEHPEPYHPLINYIVRHAIHAQEIIMQVFRQNNLVLSLKRIKFCL